MNSPWVTVRVDDLSFGVEDDVEMPVDTSDYSNGLIVTMDAGARIHTGIHTGHVQVRATAVAEPPPQIDVAEWDDIIEASVHAPRGQLRITSLYFGAVDELPLLSPQGPGWYRLRVCARGRDGNPDGVQDEPTEEYLLAAWPTTGPAPTVITRTTDRTGQGVRAGASNNARPMPPPLTAHELSDQRRKERQERKLRDVMRRNRGKPQNPDA